MAQLNLNKFVGLGCPAWKEARAKLQKLLSGKFLPPLLRQYFVLQIFIFLALCIKHNKIWKIWAQKFSNLFLAPCILDIIESLSILLFNNAATEPTLRDNPCLRQKALVPMVGHAHIFHLLREYCASEFLYGPLCYIFETPTTASIFWTCPCARSYTFIFIAGIYLQFARSLKTFNHTKRNMLIERI